MTTSRRPAVIPALAGLAALACLVLPPPSASAAVDRCLSTRSTSDFDGDGYDDAAVGDPYATVEGKAGAGAVTVLYGDSDGRIGEGRRQVITLASFGDQVSAGDHFGFDVALAPARPGSRCADLLVGSPGADLTGRGNAGMAHLIRDLPDAEGTPAMEALLLTQADAGGTVEAGDEFGSTVAVTGPTSDGPGRLVVGAPGENAGRTADVGAVNLWRIDSTPVGLGELRQGGPAPGTGVRLPGTPQAGDRFGTSLASGQLDLAEQSGPETGQGLVIGAPGDTVAGRDGAGSVTVLQERFQSATLISQDSAGVPGAAEAADQFGYSVALSPQVGPEPRTLAVGAPGEAVGSRANAGSVTLFGNTAERFVPRTALTQDSNGVPGAVETGDRFGFSLTFGHRVPTLLVGAPTEDVGSTVNAGLVQPVRVPGTALPLAFPAAITENTTGTPGAVGRDHWFGRSVGALSGQSENILTVASVYTGLGSVFVLSDRAGSAPRSWLPSSGAARFGWSVTN